MSESFRCPVCRNTSYARVVVPRRNGLPYRTVFFACKSCTTMFLDPVKFTRAPRPPLSVVPAAPDLTRLWPK